MDELKQELAKRDHEIAERDRQLAIANALAEHHNHIHQQDREVRQRKMEQDRERGERLDKLMQDLQQERGERFGALLEEMRGELVAELKDARRELTVVKTNFNLLEDYSMSLRGDLYGMQADLKKSHEYAVRMHNQAMSYAGQLTRISKVLADNESYRQMP